MYGNLQHNIKRGRDGPVAVETILGLVLNGPVQIPNRVTTQLTNSHVLELACINPVQPDDPIIPKSDTIDQSLDKFWVVESSGIVPEEYVNIVTKS